MQQPHYPEGQSPPKHYCDTVPPARHCSLRQATHHLRTWPLARSDLFYSLGAQQAPPVFPRKQERLAAAAPQGANPRHCFTVPLQTCKQEIHVFLSADFYGMHPKSQPSAGVKASLHSTVHTAEADRSLPPIMAQERERDDGATCQRNSTRMWKRAPGEARGRDGGD